MLHNEYTTTVGLLKLPFAIPKFTIEKKDLLERFLHLSEHKDIDYIVYEDFPDDYLVKVSDKKEMDNFVTDKFKDLITIGDLHHIESNGEAILIFSNDFRLAQLQDYVKMIHFAENLKSMIGKEKGDS